MKIKFGNGTVKVVVKKNSIVFYKCKKTPIGGTPTGPRGKAICSLDFSKKESLDIIIEGLMIIRSRL